MKLTRTERMILRNQFKILQLLGSDEMTKKDFGAAIEALEWGYELEYEHLFQMIDAEPLSEDRCRELVDIMDMHRALVFANRELPEGERLPDTVVQFRGFDGNTETTELAFCRWFCTAGSPERFQELTLAHRDGFNSHSEELAHYREMLTRWRALGGERLRSLSRTQILAIVPEWRHPKE